MPNNIDSPDQAQYLYDNWAKYLPKKIFADPESPDLISALKKKFGNIVSNKVNKSVQLGI